MKQKPVFLTSLLVISLVVWPLNTLAQATDKANNKEETNNSSPNNKNSGQGLSEFELDLIYDQKLEEKNQLIKDPLRLNIGWRYFNGFIENYNRIHQLSFNGSYQFKKSWFLSFNQSLNHQRFKFEGKSPFRLSNTSFSLQKSLSNLTLNSQARIGLSSSIPTSAILEKERLEGTLNTTSLNVTWITQLLPLFNLETSRIKNLYLLIQPVGSYYFSRWKTTPTGQNSQGGSPLPQMSFGFQRISLSLTPTDSLNFSGAFGFWLLYYYKSKYQRDKHSFYKRSYPNNIYFFSLSASWNVTKQLGLSLSYSLRNRADKQGRYELLLFDDRFSSWVFSVDYSLFSANSLDEELEDF